MRISSREKVVDCIERKRKKRERVRGRRQQYMGTPYISFRKISTLSLLKEIFFLETST